jgi:hypothetical protein
VTQVSDIIVVWNPEDSGQVQSIQIQSRVAGTTQWAEQAAAFDPAVGTFRFQSNAPASDVEVRTRYRATSGVFGAWNSPTIRSAGVAVAYDMLTGLPTSLSDISPGEGGKLEGIAEGATVGAPAGTNVAGVPASDLVDAIKDSTGTIKPVREQIADGNAILDVKITAAQKAGTDASAQAAQVRIDLVPTITAARAAATQVSTDLSSEVARAKNAEGTLLTKIESAQGGADGAYSLIATETLQRTEKDAALTQRIDTVTATADTDRSNAAAAITSEATTRSTDIAAVGRRVDSVTADYKTADGVAIARIVTEEIASATRDEALGRRTNTLESRSTGGGNLLANTDFLTLAGWTKDYGTAIEEINAAGSNWQLGGVENNLSLHDVSPSPTVYSQITSQQFAVEPGSYIQFSALVAAHRARGWVTVFFYDANGVVVAYGGENYGTPINGGGSNIVEHDLVGIKSFQVPSTAVRANMALRMYPNMPSVDPYAWFHRPYVGIARAGQAEWNPYATGSAKTILAATNAAVREEAITRASQTEALVGRSATLEAQLRGELGSFINTRIANEEVARSTAVESIANRSAALESQFRGDTDSAVFARLRVEETTRATADNALVNRAMALEARATGGGNLLTSTDFQTTVGWAFTSGNLPAATLSAGLNIAGSNYHLENENTLSIYQGGNAGLGFGGYCEWYGAGTEFAVQAGKFMQFYVYYNSHRANTMLYISWMNADGVIFLNSTTVPYGPTDKIGSNLNNYVQIGHPSIRVPDSAVKARMVLRKFDTDPGHADSYAWFVRPYAGIVREGTTEWNPYSPGSGKVAINAANARISAEETARANADGALGSRIDSVNATYSYLPQANVDRYNEAVNLNARVSNEAIASANRDGALGSRIDSVTATANGASSSASVALAAAQDAATKLGQARVTLAADAGNGRAQLSLYSDSYGNTGVDIVGNTTFKGSLDVGANSGGNRMKITSQLIEVFDANGVPRIRLGFW